MADPERLVASFRSDTTTDLGGALGTAIFGVVFNLKYTP